MRLKIGWVWIVLVCAANPCPADLVLFQLPPTLYQLSTLNGGKLPVFIRDLCGLEENPAWIHYQTGKEFQSGYGYNLATGQQITVLGTTEQLENTYFGIDYNFYRFSEINQFHLVRINVGYKTPYLRFGLSPKIYFQDSLPRNIAGGYWGLNLDLGFELEPIPGLLLDGATQNLVPLSSEQSSQIITLEPTFRNGVKYYLDPEQTLCLGLDYFHGRMESRAGGGTYYGNFSIMGMAYKRFIRIWSAGVGLGAGLVRIDSTRYSKQITAVLSYIPRPELGHWFLEVQPGWATLADDYNASVRVKLGLGWGGISDQVKPEARVETDKPAFSPDGDGVNDEINFKLYAQDDIKGKGLQEWALVICSPDSLNRMQIVKSFSGAGLPPSTIAWNGRTAGHRIAPSGGYFYQLWAVDRAKNSQKTKWQKLIIE
jgi:hypothetical protein